MGNDNRLRCCTPRTDGFGRNRLAPKELLRELAEVALAGAASSDPDVTARALDILAFGAPAIARLIRTVEGRL